jgi:hypothetical protein
MEEQLEEIEGIDVAIASQPPTPPSHGRSIYNEAEEFLCNQLFIGAPLSSSFRSKTL